ncbi:hypothetical protein N786_00555 [Bacillus amyloliquefaciens UASWS BA1]|nr:hypothetical protein U722_19775 [Bacillus amyloliquefaciens LFB112]ERK85073.1 hypothetical protein N786_00555 [Bacillus amyloliquefaciens UASWS BA1]
MTSPLFSKVNFSTFSLYDEIVIKKYTIYRFLKIL